MNFAAIVVAAGKGVRFGRPKQLIELAGRPLIAWSLSAFAEVAELGDLIIATEREHIETMRALAARFAPRLVTLVVEGGATRQESVGKALAAVPRRCDAVFVHDGARPLVRAADIRAGMLRTEPGTAVLLAGPITDTVKVVAIGTETVLRTLERSELWGAQTPQFAALADLRRAHGEARHAAGPATDDAMLLEQIGCRVVVLPASGPNFKVTTPGDDALAEAILRERQSALARR